MSDLILSNRPTTGKYLKFLAGWYGRVLRDIFACAGVLFPFFLLHSTQAVTIFVQQVGLAFLSCHLDFGIT
jgi:hypothetical protein